MTALTRWNSFREMDELQRRMSSLCDWGNFRRGNLTTNDENITVPEWAPLVDVAKDDKEYLIKVELPGVQKNDVKVTVESGTYRLSPERLRRLKKAVRDILGAGFDPGQSNHDEEEK